MAQNELINRRIAPRFSFEESFVLEVENFKGTSKSVSENLSVSGARLVSDVEHDLGSIVSVEIPSKKLQLMGEVRWIKRHARGSTYHIGVAFHDLFPSTNAKISEMINTIQTQNTSTVNDLQSFELDADISTFLNDQSEPIQSKTDTPTPLPPERRTKSVANFSSLTPTRPTPFQNTAASFRLEQPLEEAIVPTQNLSRAIALTLLALSLCVFKTTFTQYFKTLFAISVETRNLQSDL